MLSTLASTLPRDCHFGLLPQTLDLLWFMAGTTGLEPATSAVTVLPFEVFQRLTSPWGTPKATQVV